MHFQNFFKKANLKYLIIGFITIFCFFSYLYLNKNAHQREELLHSARFDCENPIPIPDSFAVIPTKVLNDKNDVHLAYAMAYGLKKVYISNQEFEEDSTNVLEEKKLVHIKNNPLYHIKELKHSYPYLIPEMSQLLNDIGFSFKEKMEQKGKGHYLMLITSGLRTGETQQNLTKSNRNAAQVSAHLFGTTVDISYKNVYDSKADSLVQDYEAVQALTQTMQEFREQCRLVVVRERKQACFHTTVVVCPPKFDVTENKITNE